MLINLILEVMEYRLLECWLKIANVHNFESRPFMLSTYLKLKGESLEYRKTQLWKYVPKNKVKIQSVIIL